MNKMADTVVRKNNDAEKEEERRVLKYQLEKEEREKLQEMKQKEQMRKKYEDIRSKLDQQVQQKKAQKEYEFLVNDDHMKRWIQITEQQDNQRKQKEEQNKLKKLEVKDYLLMQMGEDGKEQSASQSVMAKKRQKSVGEHMNVEELRLNKALLKEISRKRKEKMLNSELGSQVDLSINYN